MAARLKVRKWGRKRRLSTVLRIFCMRPPPLFPRDGNATSYFSRRERMEMEAEMNATVTSRPRISAVVCISHKRDRVFFRLATVHTHPFFFFAFIDPSRVAGSRKGKAEKRRGTKGRKIFARMLWAWVPKSVSNAVIRKAIRLERESNV